MDVKTTELVARLTARECERGEILVKINTRRLVRGEKAAAIKGAPEPGVSSQ